MLYKSGFNLQKDTISFIENNDSVTLFSAYLKLDELSIINQSKKINRIIVRWEIQDLCLKVSDIELYEYCLKNNIALYRNTRIHLKVLWDNSQSIFFGSANVTSRGIGEKGVYNYELNGSTNELSFEDIAYFNEIIIKSEYVTSALLTKIKSLVEQTELPTFNYPVLNSQRNKSDYFLLSNLPMTETVDELFTGYISQENLTISQINYITHDIALYNIPNELNRLDFYNYLEIAFNSHPFVLKLKDQIKCSPRQSMNYGSVVRWIQENTTTVPTPRSWQIKKDIMVNILYNWICRLDDDFKWDAPNYSQIILYKGRGFTR